MPTDAELVAMRLARIKFLIDSLESVSSVSAQERDRFEKLRAEVADALKVVRPTTANAR